jgi:uncharacterized protein YegP (UPF0339 family)
MRKPEVMVYRDRAGEWRWRLTVNGRIVADSGEGYSSMSNARRAWRSLRRWLAEGLS